MKIGGILGEIGAEVLEQGGSLVKQGGKQIAGTPSDLAKTVGAQVNPISVPSQEPPEKAEESSQAATADKSKQTQDDMLKAMYGKSDKKETELQAMQKKSAEEVAQKHPEMTPEEVQKAQQLKQQLHQEYYQGLINPPKQQEERPAEKVEKEKEKEEMEDLEKEKKKPEPLVDVDNAEHKMERRGSAG